MALWMPSSGPGWVYVLTSPALPGVCKIGETRRTAEHRAREVSRSYGVAQPFQVASRHAVSDRAAIEWLAHRELRRCRLPASELFQCDPDQAAAVIKSAAMAYRPPSLRWRRLRRVLVPAPTYRRQGASPSRRYRRGTNWLPLLLGLSIAAGVVAIGRPAVPAWVPPSIARTLLTLERLR